MSAPATANHDVLIVGAGLPGMALALALRGSGLGVALVDRQQPVVGDDDGWDARIYAISPGNAQFLHRIGVWSRIDCERLTGNGRLWSVLIVRFFSAGGCPEGSHTREAFAGGEPKCSPVVLLNPICGIIYFR